MADTVRETDARPPSSERTSVEHFINTKARSRANPPKYAKFTDSNTHPLAATAAAPTRINLPGTGWQPITGG
jgi:hypothetical protein